jgi:PTS system ascorbate-specific IIC component
MLGFLVEFFGTPVIVLGLVALIGLIAQRKTVAEIFVGTLKTMLGFLVMLAGITTLVSALGPISEMFFTAYGLEGFFPQDEAVVAAVASVLGRQTALILGGGFILNVVLARITPWKYIYLTGHMMWIHAGAWAILLYNMGLPEWAVVGGGIIIQGLYTTLFPAWAQPYMRKITGGNEIGFGHGQTTLCVLGAYLCKLVGKSPSAEEMKMPKGLEFFRDMSINFSIIMLLVALPAALIIGISNPEAMATIAGGKNHIMFAITEALTFVAGVLVLLQGVRMFIADLVPAFRGIAMRVVPGAIPALDCPVIYPYAPTSLLIGLVTGTIAQLVAIGVLILIGWPITLPNMIGAFFASGSGAIFGNAVAGRRGAILGGFFWCFAAWILGSFWYHYQIMGDMAALGAKNIGFLCPDIFLISAIIRLIGLLFGLTP